MTTETIVNPQNAAVAGEPAVSTWNIDPVHSAAEFAVKHMMVTTVKGRMNIAQGTLRIDEGEPARSQIEATIDAASVNTGVETRDAHLRSDDFFSAERFPTLSFRGTKVERIENENWRMTGDLTVRDVTRSVVLDVEFEGRGIDAYGNDRAGFTATTKISRKDFGINWNAVIEAGGVAVGDTVKIELRIAAVRQAA
jgi:polyisoprenoid-binding protein YceI